MKVFILVLVGFALLLLLKMNKKQIHKITEFLSVYWFRIAFAFLLLFTMNIAGGFLGIYVPVNVISGLTLAILGIPGLAAICAFALFL